MSNAASLLVVEDDAFTGRMMDLQFSKAGYDVTLATSGEEALACLGSQSFDLVLTDVMMPGISGLDVLDELRKQYNKDALPVILLTALDNAKSILEGLERGANDFMGKTNEFGIVLAKVKHHLRVRELFLASKKDAASEEPVEWARTPRDCLWNWHLARNVFKPGKRWATLLGESPEALGEGPEILLDRIHSDDRDRFDEALRAHQERRIPCISIDVRMRHALGHEVMVHFFGIAMFSREGEAQRMVGSMTPLTEASLALRQMEELKGRIKNLAKTYPEAAEALNELFT